MKPDGARAEVFRLEHGAGEPTLGIDDHGTIFISAVDACVTSCPGSTEMADSVRPGGRAVFRSSDRGRTWVDVTPTIEHPISLDPYMYLDRDTQRVFSVDLTANCSFLSFSDDRGDSWTSNPIACGEPINDHQTVFSGPPVTSTTTGHANVLYYCFHQYVLGATRCTKSLDGGVTFLPTGNIEAPDCSGLNGHGVVDSRGTIYVPMAYSCGQPALAISKDEGVTWESIVVAGLPAALGDPSVAVDARGNLYYLFVAAGERLPYLVTSTNGGRTWSEPVMVAAPGVRATNLATIDVGDPGRVAIAYYGTESRGWDLWTGYITVARATLNGSPWLLSAAMTHRNEALKVGDCGPGRCGRVLDFIDVEIDQRGQPWAAFVDACLETCESDGVESIEDNQGLVGTLVGGFELL